VSCPWPQYQFLKYSYEAGEHPHPGWNTGGRLSAWYGRKLPGPLQVQGVAWRVDSAPDSRQALLWHAKLLTVLGWDVEEARIHRHQDGAHIHGKLTLMLWADHVAPRIWSPTGHCFRSEVHPSFAGGAALPAPAHVSMLADVEVRKKEVRVALRLRGKPSPTGGYYGLPLSGAETEWSRRLQDDVWAQRAPNPRWEDFLAADYPEIRQWGEDLAELFETLIGQAKWGLMSPLEQLGYCAAETEKQ
jgi:hypothetical protein